MPVLNRNEQVGIKIEAVEATEEALVAADFQGNRKEVQFRLSVADYDRALRRGSITPLPKLKGSISGNISWTEEFVGGDASTEPPWGAALRALGFQVTTLRRVDASGLTNTFKVGELSGNNASQGSATKTVRFVYHDATAGFLVYMPVSGGDLADADTLFGYESTPQPQLTIDSDTNADAGRGYLPLTETESAVPPSATVDYRVGGISVPVVGARGTGSLSMRQNEPMLLQIEMTGVPKFDIDNRITDAVDDTTVVPTSTVFAGTSALSASDDVYVGKTIVFTSGARSGESAVVTAYSGATRQFTVAPALTGAPADTDTFQINDTLGDGLLRFRQAPVLSAPSLTDPPKMTRGIPLRLISDQGTYTPIATEATVAFNNEIAQRPSIADNAVPVFNGVYDGATFKRYSGFMSTRITGRAFELSMDPEYVLVSEGHDIAKHYLQEEPFEMFAQLGVGSDPNGAVMIVAPLLQREGDLEPGDRDGIMTTPITAMLSGDFDDEMQFYHIFHP